MKYILFFLSILIWRQGFSQLDTAFILKLKSLDTANILQRDTMPVPNDRITDKIRVLRKLRTGLTTETVLKIKLMEESGKNSKLPKEYYERLKTELLEGRAHQLLENSIINLYRRTYTSKEIRQLTKFYKSSAGRKSDKESIMLLVESVKAAEKIMDMTSKSLMAEMRAEGKIKN